MIVLAKINSVLDNVAVVVATFRVALIKLAPLLVSALARVFARTTREKLACRGLGVGIQSI
jgi:hypothetical protein